MSAKWRDAGVADALNAVAFDAAGVFAYAYDRGERAIIRISSGDGASDQKRVVLRLDAKLRRRRWLVYCLFHVDGTITDDDERLVVCLYDQKKARFCLAELTIDIKKRALHTRGAGDRHYLRVGGDSTPPERLGYAAQASGGVIEVRRLSC